MTILGTLLERRSSPVTLAGLLRGDGRAKATAGVPVDADRAMQHSAWWQCVDLLSRLVATLPVDEIRYEGGRRIPVDDPSPIVERPSSLVSPITWRRQVLISWLTRGNVWGWVGDGDPRTGYPTSVDVLEPDAVTFRRETRTGVYRYYVHHVETALYPVGRLWHVPAMTPPGCPIGLSPVSYAALALGIGLAAQGYGGDWFAEGGHPTSVLETDQRLDTPDGDTISKGIKSRFRQAVRGDGPVVLGAGTKWRSVQIAPAEAQFLETIRANRTDIANFFGLDPGYVGGETGNSRTYANVEQRSLDLLTLAVGPWVALLEEAYRALLPPGRGAKLKTDALVRVDFAGRNRGYEVGIRNGWLSRNEVRALEDRAPLDGGDETLWPPYRAFPLVIDDDVPEADAP